MNPLAYFDYLAIAIRLQKRLENVASAEIHIFSYLSCLLSLYEQHPVSDWGYCYAGIKQGVPFSYELEDVGGYLLDVGKCRNEQMSDFFKITDEGMVDYRTLLELNINQNRVDYIEGACSSLLSMPIGCIREAIIGDTEIDSACTLKSIRPLLQDYIVDDLYVAFSALSQKLGTDVQDLMIPAVVWLRYLEKRRDR